MNLDCLWDSADAERALDTLATRCDIAVSARSERLDGELGDRLQTQANRLGVEVVPCSERYLDIEATLRSLGPALIPFERDGEIAILAIIKSGRRRLQTIAPDGSEKYIPVVEVGEYWRAALRADLAKRVPETFGASLKDGDRVRETLVAAQCRHKSTPPFYLVRPADTRNELATLRAKGIRNFAAFIASSLLRSVAWVLAWWFLGTAALHGHVDAHLATAFVLVLATFAVFRLLACWFEGRTGLYFGLVVRTMAMRGVLGMQPQSLRNEGIGQLMGRAIEIETIERMAISGGLIVFSGAIDLATAAIVLWLSATGPWLVLALAAFVVIAILIGRRYVRLLAEWTDKRLALTHDLVEKLVGHRTRLIQLRPELWNREEDRVLASYLETSRRMDSSEANLEVLLPRGFLLVGITIMGALLVGGASTGHLAIGLGGVLVGWNALIACGQGIRALGRAAISHDRAGDLFSSRPVERELPVAVGAVPEGERVLELSRASYAYPGSSRESVKEASLEICRGDQTLLRGPSGSGKSTLANLLSGDQIVTSGGALLHGIDRKSLGFSGWRRHSLLVPQFHQNHVFAETLLFNLQLGCGWPPTYDEYRAAESMLRDLELGPLLDRMPSGMFTRVGDSGWQLSHGERSRLFVARALLQRAEIMIFDESLAALDPITLDQCLRAIRKHADTLVLIAHP